MDHIFFVCRTGRHGPQKENAQKQNQGLQTVARRLQTQHLVPNQFRTHRACWFRCSYRRIYGKLRSLIYSIRITGQFYTHFTYKHTKLSLVLLTHSIDVLRNIPTRHLTHTLTGTQGFLD